MLVLEVIEGPDRGRCFPLPPGEPQLLGRSSEAVPLTDPAVSRRHAELTPEGDRWMLRDLASSNGTFLNGIVATGRTLIGEGDTIGIGRTRMRVASRAAFLAGPARDIPADRSGPPAPVLPDTDAGRAAALSLLWSIAADPPASDAALQQRIAAALGGTVGGDSALHVPTRNGGLTIECAAQPPEWASPLSHLAVWLSETVSDAALAADRQRLAAMGDTVAVVSHAVKNILQGLQGGAGAIELALNRGDLDLAREGWPILARNMDRIHDLTFNMLAWSRTQHLDLEPGSLQELLADVRALQAPIFEQRRVRLDTACEPIPDVPFDAAAMHQAVLNLVVNALEAAPPRTGTVRMTATLDGAEAVIGVEDNGPGVPEDAIESIFEPFASSRGQRGTGLGLAVTRRIADAHNGRVVLTVGPDQTTRFEIRLPAATRHADPGDTDMAPPLVTDPDEFGPDESEH
ncbi:MAG: ATP-binding protein [Phycisphaerales bacterium]|jgi:signal transduction histidine kinase|nr:ATP-binding protein [Phycisphaerales bacterium]